MERPTEIDNLAPDNFASYYWLKAELVEYCRTHGLPTSGSKQDLTERIKHFLATGEVRKAEHRKRSSGSAMPTTFTPETVIGENWRCSQELRRFFEAEIGSSFHFNKFLRSYIAGDGIGKTLRSAIDGWLESKKAPPGSTEIAPQFEYNRHMRDFFQKHPGATRRDAIDEWNLIKSRKK